MNATPSVSSLARGLLTRVTDVTDVTDGERETLFLTVCLRGRESRRSRRSRRSDGPRERVRDVTPWPSRGLLAVPRPQPSPNRPRGTGVDSRFTKPPERARDTKADKGSQRSDGPREVTDGPSETLGRQTTPPKTPTRPRVQGKATSR